MKKIKSIIINIKREFDEYYNGECEYGKGYLDCLYEICHQFNIQVERTEMNLHIKED